MSGRKIFTAGQPNSEPQRQFFLAQARFIGYGGARGGGKSWAAREKAMLLAFYYPGCRVLLLRRTYPELRENHMLPMQQRLHGIAKWKEAEKSFTFPNGSRIVCGYCDHESDVLQYQGQEYDFIFLEEATHFTEYQFERLTACLRGTNGYPKRMYLTCNPGGVGHMWVKRLFIDRAYRQLERAEDYQFIPARVYDNRDLVEKDPDYVRMLQNLPDELRRAWLDGDWDVFEGQYFSEFSREVHVCRPFAPPGHWRRYVSLDYGMDMLAAYWFAVDEWGRAVVYREVYEGRDNGKGAGGRGHIISAAAARLLEANGGDEIAAWLAPPDLWNRRQETGRSAADIFAEQGVTLTKTGNDRAAGWLAVREWLAVSGDEQGGRAPRLRIFDTCKNLIRTLPALQHDERRPEDAATEPHELTHAPDALRGFCAFWVDAARRQEQRRHDLLRDDFGVGAPRPGALGEGGDYQVV